jgi:hypothetical protein
MTAPTSNPNTSYAENTIVDAEDILLIPSSVALHSGSLTGNCWDDELLPSGD